MSWWNNIVNTFRVPKEIYAIELKHSSSGIAALVCHISRNKDTIDLVAEDKYDSYLDFIEEADKNIPVVAILTGQKILQKPLDNLPEDVGEAELIARAFPNIDRKSLYFQTQSNDGKAIVSATRIDTWAQLSESFEQKSARVIDLLIGPANLMGLLGQTGESRIQLGSYSFDLETNLAVPTEAVDEKVKIFDQELQNSHSLAYLTGLRFMATSGQYLANSEDLVENRKDFLYKNLYTKGMMAAGVLILIALLTSFMVYNNYFEKNQTLSQQTASYEQQIQKVKELQDSYENKVQFISANGNNKMAFSQMGDQLAATVPSGISLSGLEFFPLEKRMKKEKLVRFYQNQLRVSGETRNHNYFENWLIKVNELDWVNEIQIAGYQEKNSNHEAEFTLKITLGL